MSKIMSAKVKRRSEYKTWCKRRQLFIGDCEEEDVCFPSLKSYSHFSSQGSPLKANTHSIPVYTLTQLSATFVVFRYVWLPIQTCPGAKALLFALG
mmetsp:Transcript_34051/g.55155  ORF Transcript_34051/g.55155 Transcript_34051/m.55155 type:complete len:96 (-) Transcript_34051:85-372(-)